MAMSSTARRAPAASSTRKLAFMISVPMPSPWATVIGTGLVAKVAGSTSGSGWTMAFMIISWFVKLVTP